MPSLINVIKLGTPVDSFESCFLARFRGRPQDGGKSDT